MYTHHKDATQAFLLLSQINEVLDRFSSSFTEQERLWICNYIELITKLTISGALFDPNLRNIDWTESNVRGGVASVKGTFAEIKAVAIWNYKCGSTTCRLFPSSQTEQVAGTDVRFENPNWKRSYVGQVKTTFGVDDDKIYFNTDWVKYKKSDVDRLVLYVRGTYSILVLDYGMVKDYVDNTTRSPGVSLYLEKSLLPSFKLTTMSYNKVTACPHS